MKNLNIYLVLTAVMFCFACTRWNQAAQKVEKARVEKLTQSADEVSQYAECLTHAKSDEEFKACEELKNNFSEHTKEIMKKIKEEKARAADQTEKK